MRKKKIIIVGGGIAGLTAALELIKHFSVEILEADDRLGGRIHSVHDKNFSESVEAGAEFIHGNLRQTMSLLRRAGISWTPVIGEMLRKENGVWIEQQEIFKGWRQLLRKMSGLKGDMTLLAFLDKYYSSAKHPRLRAQAMNYAAGFDLADASKASVKSLCKEWSHEDGENFRVDGGYGLLVDYLHETLEEAGCVIKTGQRVVEINHQRKPTVTTVDGKIHQADKVMVTVPISILQQENTDAGIRFTPDLPDYRAAANAIGMGTVIKIIIEFKKGFVESGVGFIITDEVVPTWWTQLPADTALLTGWAGGHFAVSLGKLDDVAIKEQAIASLARIFNITAPRVKKAIVHIAVFDWHSNPFSLGAYSYATASSRKARRVLRTAVSNKLYFSGEALYEGNSPGTVEAAIVQGRKTAASIIAEG